MLLTVPIGNLYPLKKIPGYTEHLACVTRARRGRKRCKDHFVNESRGEVTKVRSSTPPPSCVESFEFSRETFENFWRRTLRRDKEFETNTEYFQAFSVLITELGTVKVVV